LFSLGVVLAAGEGLRMRPLTHEVPKPMLEVHGKTLLEHQINFLKDHVNSVAVTVGYMPEKVSQCALQNGADLILRNSVGGNANWLNNSIFQGFDSQIVIITCDNLMEIDLNELESESKATPELSYLVTRECEPEIRGDRISHNNYRVEAISELGSTPLLATGLQVINPGAFGSRAKFNNFHDVWNYLIDNQSLYASKSQPTSWMAIDTPLDLENARKIGK
jgi:MurNAc alpha-1-phosphate uridylyltransferase